MSLQENGRVFRSGEANTLYISIPSAVACDSAFPFDEGQEVTVSIEDDKLVISGDEEDSQHRVNRR